MIGWLQGNIIEKQSGGKLVLNVNGVGYEVETSQQTFMQLEEVKNQTVCLHIHTIVREDAFLLYGFLELRERLLFKALIKVNGVGPKVAMGILSSISPHAFISAILQEDIVRLTKLPGIGKKTAERLMIEMRDGLQHWQADEKLPQAMNAHSRDQSEAVSALEGLGYKTADVLKVMKKIDPAQKNCEQLIREALKLLSIR